MTRPRTPLVPAPSPDEDPTGVRALLSSLPAPEPMPEHLVERINASLAAEHAQRAQRAAGASGASVSPLLAAKRGRRGRLVFAAAGAAAAAAVALVSVVGNGVVTPGSSTTSAGRLTETSASNPEAAAGAATSGTKPLAPASTPGAGDGSQFNAQKDGASGATLGGAPAAGAAPDAAAVPASGSIVAIRQSETRYTQSDFVKQAKALDGVAMLLTPQYRATSSNVGPAGTPSGLRACLSALGAGSAQLVLADQASYEGQPAVIIVATTKGVPIAFAVKPQCSRAGAAVLRPATPLR